VTTRAATPQTTGRPEAALPAKVPAHADVTSWLLASRRWMVVIPGLLLAFTALTVGASLLMPGQTWQLSHPTTMVWSFVNLVAVGPAVLFMLAGLLRPVLSGTRRQPAPACEARTRFVIIVPAYNEERVIANSVTSLLAQDYPGGLFELHVAFNGMDGTGQLARTLGAQVYQTSRAGIGKSAAIAQALQSLRPADDAYVVICDADNVVSPGFLRAMDRTIQHTGALALQGNHKPLTANDNVVSVGIRAAYRASSLYYNVGRSWLLRSALLCGTGFAVQAALFASIWPKVRTQTEDIESNALLQLDHGLGVVWVEDAEFFDEKPDQLAIAIRQRVRWMVGHIHTAQLYAWPLLRRSWCARSMRSLELALYYLLPIALLLSTIWYLVAIPAMVVGVGVFHPTSLALTWTGAALGLVYVVVMPMLASLHEQKSFALRACALALRDAAAALAVSLVVWSTAILLAMLCLRRKDWIFHTPHKAAALQRPAP
jgi:cellulose synthase/poly-beta-1,6-N-acetylglucosamine synthase-like glycosyltransferase